MINQDLKFKITFRYTSLDEIILSFIKRCLKQSNFKNIVYVLRENDQRANSPRFRFSLYHKTQNIRGH